MLLLRQKSDGKKNTAAPREVEREGEREAGNARMVEKKEETLRERRKKKNNRNLTLHVEHSASAAWLACA